MQPISYIAFFDVDETIINCKTMLSYLKFFYIKISSSKWIGTLRFNYFQIKSLIYQCLGKDRNFLNNHYYSNYKGFSMDFLMSISEEWFAKLIQSVTFNNKALKELKDHQLNGAEIVLVSGSFMPCLLPIAKKLGIRHILAINLEEKNEKFTGRILSPQTIGTGKAEAIKGFINKYPQISLNNCYAYGDHDSDLAMLSLVGNPVVVGNNSILIKEATNKNWKIIN